MFGEQLLRQNFWIESIDTFFMPCQSIQKLCGRFIILMMRFCKHALDTDERRPCSSLPFRIRITHQIASGQVVELSICTTVPTKYISALDKDCQRIFGSRSQIQQHAEGQLFSDFSLSVSAQLLATGDESLSHPHQHFSNLWKLAARVSITNADLCKSSASCRFRKSVRAIKRYARCRFCGWQISVYTLFQQKVWEMGGGSYYAHTRSFFSSRE